MDIADLQPAVKVIIRNSADPKGAAFGPGIAALCRGIRETGSLNAAAKHMQMAYSKAWRIIKEAEDSLDCQILIRNGAHGSTLTPDAEYLLTCYDRICDKIHATAAAQFEEIKQQEKPADDLS